MFIVKDVLDTCGRNGAKLEFLTTVGGEKKTHLRCFLRALRPFPMKNAAVCVSIPALKFDLKFDLILLSLQRAVEAVAVEFAKRTALFVCFTSASNDTAPSICGKERSVWVQAASRSGGVY